MSTTPSSSLDLGHAGAVLPVSRDAGEASRYSARTAMVTRAEARQRAGQAMILAGFVITIVGVILYCAACFAGGVDADMGAILLRNAVPFARGTLAVLGLGTLVWLVGSVTYLRGAMDAEDVLGAQDDLPGQ